MSESTLMRHVGYATTSPRTKTWGDPNLGFVGRLNGIQNSTGYGVHWRPIARVAEQYRTAFLDRRMTVSQLTAALDAGQPIIVWGTTGKTARPDAWPTPDGKLVKAWHGEHTRVVIGYEGPAKSPTHIILVDPISGRLRWTTHRFRANWAAFHNTGVIVS